MENTPNAKSHDIWENEAGRIFRHIDTGRDGSETRNAADCTAEFHITASWCRRIRHEIAARHAGYPRGLRETHRDTRRENGPARERRRQKKCDTERRLARRHA